MPALRVTFVAPFGLRRKGTTRARVIPLAAALAARGHRVRVVVPAWDSPEDWGRRDRLPGARRSKMCEKRNIARQRPVAPDVPDVPD